MGTSTVNSSPALGPEPIDADFLGLGSDGGHLADGAERLDQRGEVVRPMSNSGPAPYWKRNAGFGCQDSGPGVWNVVMAVSGVPMSPRSMSRRAVCSPAPRNVSGAVPRRMPAASAVFSRPRPDSRSSENGFSVQTCLPASTAAVATSTCAAGMVRLTMISTSGWFSAASTPPHSGMPYSFARASAASSKRSATTRTFRSGKTVRLSRYCLLMFPAPMTPTPTGPRRKRAGAAHACAPSVAFAEFRKASDWVMPSKMSPE